MKFSIRFAWCLGLLMALSGCGGGGSGGGDSPTATVSGVAVDGYLYKATAFLDLNGNGLLDTGEPSAQTKEHGEFSLNASAEQKANASVVIQAIAGTTIDQDLPNTPMTQSMTMVAPAGHPEVVSPLTTLVAATMKRENKSLEAAKSSVGVELGLSPDLLLQNFVAQAPNNEAATNAYKVAVALGEVLKSASAQLAPDAGTNSKFEFLSANLGSVTDHLDMIKGSKLSELNTVRAFIANDIELNNLSLTLNDKWQAFLRNATTLQVLTESIAGKAKDLTRDPDFLTITRLPEKNQITLSLGLFYSRTITFSATALQTISTTLLNRTETVDLMAASPQMAASVNAGDFATLFSKVASQTLGVTCAKSTGSYAVYADTTSSLKIKLTIEESDLVDDIKVGCSKSSAIKEVYSFRLTADDLSLKNITVLSNGTEILALGF